jgi:group I intron endonuclease
MSTTNQEALWEEKNSIELEKSCLNSNAIEQKDTMKEIKLDLITSQCNDIGKISGIYKIINKVNGKYYVGSSNNILKRLKHHINRLKNNKHVNDYLQNAWNKYQITNFKFYIIECVNSNLLYIEQKYLNIAKTEQHISYNLKFIVSGGDISDYSKQKISKALKNRIVSNETKEKLKISHLGHKLSNKTKQILSDLQSGKKLSIDSKNKISNYFKNKKLSTFHKEKLSTSAKSRHITFSFYNTETNNNFYGTKSQFYKTFNLNRHHVVELLNKKRNNLKGWILSS